jgi:phosphoribosylformylglycinamidine synthase
MKEVNFLILAGDGINCERETAFAFRQAGARAKIVHINDLIEQPSFLRDYQGLAIPGGFSFGDELGSGQILALKLKHRLGHELEHFVREGKAIIGICNGFQVLVKLGLLPFPFETRAMALSQNKSGYFIDRWVELEVVRGSVCKWISEIESNTIELPVRHKEGRVEFAPQQEEVLFSSLWNKGQIPFRYKEEVNGSYQNIAGVCDPSGMILGLMPHPEGYLFQATYKNTTRDPYAKGMGQYLFDGIVKYFKNL